MSTLKIILDIILVLFLLWSVLGFAVTLLSKIKVPLFDTLKAMVRPTLYIILGIMLLLGFDEIKDVEKVRHVVASIIPYIFIVLLIVSYFIYKYSYKISENFRKHLFIVSLISIFTLFSFSLNLNDYSQRFLRSIFLNEYKELAKTREEYSDDRGELIPFITYSTSDAHKNLKNNLIEGYLIFQTFVIPFIILRFIAIASEKSRKEYSKT